MALEHNRIQVGPLVSDESGNLVKAGYRADYQLQDSSDNRKKVNGAVALTDLNGSNTLDEVWAAIRAQIEAAEGM